MDSSTEFVNASELRYEPNTVLTNHIHENPYFCAILAGGYSGKYGSKLQHGHPGESVFRPVGETHCVRFHALETRILMIEFSRGLWVQVCQHCRGLGVSSEFTAGRITWLAKRLWMEYRLGDDCSRIAVKGLLLEMLAEVSRQDAPSPARVPQWLIRVKEHIEDTFAQGLSIDALARIADVHPVYLITAFKRAFRLTPGEFQRQLRVRRAQELMMKTPTVPLAEIALVTGFFDQSHFSRAFKQVTCLTPSGFREQGKKKVPPMSKRHGSMLDEACGGVVPGRMLRPGELAKKDVALSNQ